MEASTEARVLIVANKTAATPTLIQAVRERATAGRARFCLLVPKALSPCELCEERVGRPLGAQRGDPHVPGIDRRLGRQRVRQQAQRLEQRAPVAAR